MVSSPLKYNITRFYLILILTALGFYLLIASPLSEESLNTLLPIKLKLTPSLPKAVYQPLTPSIEHIFSSDHQLPKDLPQEKVYTLIATGDIIPSRSVNFQTVSKNNFLWPYEKVADQLKAADITFANLESPLFEGCQPTQQGMVFCGDAKNAEGLVYGGVDIVSLANNHAGNYGLEGVQKTTQLLEHSNINVTGISGPTYLDIKGMKFAFLGYNEIGHKEKGISWAEDNIIRQEITNASSKADIVIVAFHWGIEYVSQPTQRQRELAHLAVDSGADLIIGNHPHWIQPVEIYQGKVITYAHGNLIFDQMWSQKTREGVLGRYTFFDKQLIDVQFLPVQIDDYGQPHFIEGIQKDQILEEMKAESLKLAEKN